ncbi:MAG: hypothetical protein A4E74_01962 [Syntrophus sp. PtaB.Bin075]|nr:MAG: hypothetical protein A4E74_01962 [Syntrophus sp. PtaB.Bin075]
MPMTGETTMKMVVLVMPFQTRTSVPPFTIPAPISPPISAWDELLGNPKYQVMRFQIMAALSVAKMSRLSIMRGSMMPVPIVLATGTPIKRKAIKLKNAAQRTAYFGESTRVETTVAMEFAES